MSVRIMLETATPLFLGGADQNTPELRPSSMRGALRYWLRALVGAEVGEDLKALRKQEYDVFGTTDIGSPILVRLAGVPAKMENFTLDTDAQGRQEPTGYNYFYYFTQAKPNERVPFAPATNLTLRLDVRRGVYQPKELLCKSLAAAWLLTHLGGLGMRSRRCAGDLQAVIPAKADDALAHSVLSELPAFPVAAQDTAGLQAELASGLKTISSLITRTAIPEKTAGTYDVLHPDVCKVWVFDCDQKWKKWNHAADDIGSVMQKFRANQGANRNEINSVFGIPILHGPRYGLQRRASPVWLRLTKLADETYIGVATLFYSDFMKNQYEVGGGYAHIEDFVVNELYGQEVNYR